MKRLSRLLVCFGLAGLAGAASAGAAVTVTVVRWPYT